MRPIVNVPEEDRATDTGNMHKKSGKDRACGSGDILADGQTHRQTDQHTDKQTYSSQYFEVNICVRLLFRFVRRGAYATHLRTVVGYIYLFILS